MGGPYADAHRDPQGEGDARPTALQVIKDEGVEGKLKGKVIVIAGATSGIGVETARALKETGARLILTARNRERAETNLAGIVEPGRVSLVELDLDSFKSIRAAADKILAETKGQINILINSAGVMGLKKYTLTEDGIEAHFSSNYLGFFLLFQLLKPALLASATDELHSRVVIVSSSAHRAGALPASDNYNFEQGGYNHEVAYNNSKLAAVYLANKIERDYGSRGLHATSLHPGAVNNTGISRNVPLEFVQGLLSNPDFVKILKSPAQGAATTVWAAISKEWENRGGRYLEDVAEAERGQDDGNAFGAGWVKQTYDPAEEDRLWRDSHKLVGLEGQA
ncbi:hypothetical protein VTN31DRAFT_3629 [Thermomyces dupontii]|uniref:uncharacterized protein n=1 Tax=Talaromyces thermophilus TaxID=28565 RepID=UPI003742252D